MLGAWASGVAAHRLRGCSSWAVKHGLNSCDARASQRMDLSGSGTELTSPVLAGGCFTSELPGKS